MIKETHDFVTYKVPGFPNGTVLEHEEGEPFRAGFTDELGILHQVVIPVTASAIGAHVRTVKRKEGS